MTRQKQMEMRISELKSAFAEMINELEKIMNKDSLSDLEFKEICNEVDFMTDVLKDSLEAHGD